MIRRSVVGIVAVISLVSIDAFGIDLSWTPRARTLMRLDDNIRTASDNPEGALGFDTIGDISFRAQTDTLSSELVPHVNVRRFAIGNNLDADEYSVSFNNDWKRENYGAGLDFSYSRDSTLASEATDAGRVEDVKNRDSIMLEPRLTYLFSDRLQSDINFLFNDVSYKDAETTGLIDYTFLQTSTSLSFLLRPSLQIYGRLLVSNFEVPDLASKTQSYSAQFGFKWNWDPTLEFSGGAGWIQSYIAFHELQFVPVLTTPPQFVAIRVSGDASSGGPVANASIAKSFDETKSTFTYVREVSPSGRGAQSTSDRMLMNVVHRWDERTNILFDGLYEMRSAQADSIPGVPISRDLNRDYYEVRAGFRYQLRRSWALNASYRFGRRVSTNVGSTDSAATNSVLVILDWNGDPHRILSRF